MRRTILLTIIYFALTWMVCGQNNPGWATYLEGYRITDIGDAGEYLWLCSNEDLHGSEIIQFEKASGSVIHYGYDILGISSEYSITSIKCDKNDLPWAVGTFSGILRMTEDNKWILIPSPFGTFSSSQWSREILIADNGVVWTYSNDTLFRYNGDSFNTFGANGNILSLAEDKERNKWMGIELGGYARGLAKFDGKNWTTIYFYPSNGERPFLHDITFDELSNIWMVGTFFDVSSLSVADKLVKFDYSAYQVYDPPSNIHFGITSPALQGDGVCWLGTDKGLMKFNDSQWTVFNTDNSGLPSNDVHSVVVDNDGTKWIGTGNGLAKFNLTTTIGQESIFNHEFGLFPNPANDFITLKISGEIQNTTVDILNIQGKTIKTFNLNNNETRMDVSSFPAGVYLVTIQSDENHFIKKFAKQ